MKYRREIDGLRAIAVLPVILFHAGFEVFGGGFVGVDVFFVISGYLITGIILEDLKHGRFTIAGFYERRARRILPALFFVMLCCVPLAWVLMLPSQFEDFSKSLIAVSLFGSNILFGGQDGYFGPTAETQPLLHTWSLAVEEQYYIVFPLLLMALWRYRRNRILTVIVALAILSLIVAELGWRYNPKANFYFTPSRIWELLAGALCAFAPRPRPGVKGNLLSLLGLGMIVASILTFDESLPFPSLYTLAPVAGCALIILFAAPQTWTARLLSIKPFVGIGLISYSAYLWHQPMFVFARLSSVEGPSQAVLLALAATSLGLAYLSWRFVEQPFRRGPVFGFGQRRFVFSASVAGMALFILCGTAANNTPYFESNLPEKGKYYFSYIDYHKTPDYFKQYRASKCFYGSTQDSFSYFDQELCLSHKTGVKNYIIVGDSHAAHLWYAINETFPEVNVMQASASGCFPLVSRDGTYAGKKRCSDLVQFIFESYIVEHKVDGIILSGRWNESSVADFPSTIAYLKQHVPQIIVLGPTVEFTTDVPVILGANSRLPIEEIAVKARGLVNESKLQVSDAIAAAIKETSAQFVPLIPYVCRPDACTLLAGNGEPLVFDYAHFTLAGSLSIVQRLKQSGALHLD